jgi:DNA-binding response OmpR family regulator
MLKVLIVEDELMIADFLEETLVDAGYEVCGIASTMATAMALAERHNPDLGVIDLRLSGGECGTEIAAALRRRGGFGVLYATGNPHHALLEQAEGEGCISKPYLGSNVVSALRVVSERLSDRPLSAFPQGFRLLGSPSASRAA